jgi:hypothetical protein
MIVLSVVVDASRLLVPMLTNDSVFFFFSFVRHLYAHKFQGLSVTSHYEMILSCKSESFDMKSLQTFGSLC